MPDNRDTDLQPPVPEMPPGFDKLPVEQQMIIKAYKGDPEMMGVFQATKIMQLHGKYDEHDSRIISLEDSRKHAKWVGGTLVLVFGAIKGFILSKIFGVV